MLINGVISPSLQIVMSLNLLSFIAGLKAGHESAFRRGIKQNFNGGFHAYERVQ